MARKKNNSRQRRGTGGLVKKGNKYEGSITVYRQNGTGIRKYFMRGTIEEIEDIKTKFKMLGTLDNNVKDIKIHRYTNELTLIKEGQSKNAGTLNKNITVSEYVDYFLFTHRKKGVRGRKVEDITFNSYVDKGKLIKRYIGDKKVVELTFEDIESFIDELHKNTCDTTARQTRDLITSMMLYAKKDGITEENILQDNKINLKESKGKKEKKIIAREDIATFVDYCMEHKYYDLIFILKTGVRVSELAGVTWNNIDDERRTVKIEKEYTRIKKQELVNGKIVVTRTKGFKDLKSKESYRVIALDNKMLEILKQHKKEQKELAKKNNKEFKETDWVFTTKTYNGYLADYSSDKFRKVMDTIKIKNYKELTTHDLRHTYCSLGIMGGTKIEEMQKLLGHSNIAVTRQLVHTFRRTKINRSK